MMSDESTLHDSVHAFADGELEPQEADAFRVHLGTCARCQLELEDILQLQGLGGQLAEEEARTAQAVKAPAPPRAEPPRAFRPAWSTRRRAALGAVLGSALAATFAFAVLRSPSTPELDAEALALAPTRSLEARLTYGGASDWRPYGVKRSGGERPAEKVPFQTLAKLEKAGDTRGLATAWLLNGDREAAADYLRQAPESASVDSDRAVVALSKGRYEEALTLLDGVLARQPSHPQALWNRGLALRELGLELTAAQSFAKVAALNEPGWSNEARERQQALEAQVRERMQRARAATEAAQALVAQGTPMPEEVVRHAPSTARAALYAAAAAAPSAERIRALLPLARELDAHYGGDILQRHVERTALRDFGKRAPLAATAAALPTPLPDTPETEDVLRRAQAAGEEDLVLVLLERASPSPERLKQYEAAATTLGDPWFLMKLERERARVPLIAGQGARAEAVLNAALPTCERLRMDLPCLELESMLVDVTARDGRAADARNHAWRGLAMARRMNETGQEQELLRKLASAVGQDSPLARATSEELTLRAPLAPPGH